MPKPIDLQFEKLSMSSSENSASNLNEAHEKKNETTLDTKESFWRKQLTKFKSDIMVSGTFYNMATFSFLTFVVVFIVLVIFKPPLVMTTPSPTENNVQPKPQLSWTSVLVWSILMALVVFAISFFTRSKPSPSYILQK